MLSRPVKRIGATGRRRRKKRRRNAVPVARGDRNLTERVKMVA